MLTVTPEAARLVEAAISKSGIPDPVVNIVAGTGPLPVTQDLARVLGEGNKKELRAELSHLRGQRARVQLVIHPRSSFAKRHLVTVSGLTFVIPFYMRILFSLRLDYSDGQLTFTDRKGRPIYPNYIS